ncbi:hypothetical protein A2U01_0079520, partial [Trifolium medium]|nr:hypothetical protein [Trifolium medium]
MIFRGIGVEGEASLVAYIEFQRRDR